MLVSLLLGVHRISMGIPVFLLGAASAVLAAAAVSVVEDAADAEAVEDAAAVHAVAAVLAAGNRKCSAFAGFCGGFSF